MEQDSTPPLAGAPETIRLQNLILAQVRALTEIAFQLQEAIRELPDEDA